MGSKLDLVSPLKENQYFDPPPPKPKKTTTTKSQHYITPELEEVEAWAEIGHDGMGKGFDRGEYNVQC